jgi:chromate transporter
MPAWGWPELATLFLHFVSLSLLAIGGAITTVPEMHRFLVTQQAWLAEDQFSSAIALAQAAPGPNVLFVAVLGWTVGMNAAGGAAAGAPAWALASACVFAAMMGILLPSATLTYFAARWGQRNRERPTVRAFKLAMAPIVVALLVALMFFSRREQSSRKAGAANLAATGSSASRSTYSSSKSCGVRSLT